MARPKSSYISGHDKFSEGVRSITGGLLERLGDRADIGWDCVRFNTGGLRDEVIALIASFTPMFQEEDGVLYVTFRGVEALTSLQWEERLEKKDCKLNDDARRLLLSSDLTRTSGTVRVAILRSSLTDGQVLDAAEIYGDAERRNWLRPNPDLACLLRESFSDNEIRTAGLTSIWVMHQPIEPQNRFGYPSVLSVCQNVYGNYLSTYGIGTTFTKGMGTPDQPSSPGLAFVVA